MITRKRLAPKFGAPLSTLKLFDEYHPFNERDTDTRELATHSSGPEIGHALNRNSLKVTFIAHGEQFIIG